LHLEENQLTALPENIDVLSKLERLYLSKNLLVKLPTSLLHLSALNFLDLKFNRLIELPGNFDVGVVVLLEGNTQLQTNLLLGNSDSVS
jgi:Leucine-rich repeat (LRR) protein